MHKYLIVIFLFITGNMWAQEFKNRVYTAENGMVQNQVTYILLDTQGYLWVGTKGGVSVFDGLKFINYDLNSGLSGVQVVGIVESSDGRVWVLTRVGLNEFDNLKLTTYALGKSIPGFISFDGNFQYDKKRNVLYTMARTNNGDYFYSINLKKLKLSTKITKINSVYYNYLPHLDVIVYDSLFLQLNTMQKQRKYIGKTSYLYQSSDTSFFYIYDSCFLLNKSFEKIKVLPYQDYFPYRKKDGYDTLINIKNLTRDLYTSYIQAMAFPNKQTAILGAELGLFIPANHAFMHYKAEKCGFTEIWSIFQQKNLLYFMSYNGNNATLDLNTNKIKPFKNTKHYYFGHTLFDKKTELISIHNGYQFVQKNKIVSIYSDKVQSSSFIYNDTFAHNFIFCHPNGLSFMNKKKELHNFFNKDGYDFAYPLCVERDTMNRLWIVGSNRIYTYDYKNFKRIQGIIGKTGAFSVKRDKQGNLWFGTKYGLFIYNYKYFRKIVHPSLTHIITALYVLDENRLLIGTTHGLAMLNLNQFYKNDSVFVQWYDKSNGFSTSEVQQNSFYMASDGHLWVPLSNEVIRIDTSLLQFNTTAPHAIIQSITETESDIRYFVKQDSIYIFEPLSKNFRIIYSAIEYTNPEYIQFKVKLLGLNNSWSELSSERYVDFTNLEPGDYTFELIAYNESFVASEPVLVHFKIKKSWYQYSILRSLLTILLVIVLFIIYRKYLKNKIYRLNEKNQRQQDIEQLKAKLLIKQLDNHFIFNAISTATNLMQYDARTSIRYLSGLSNLLRYLISSKEAIEVTLNQELQQIFFFAEIQKIRFEGRLILSTKQRVSDQEIERIKIPKLFIYHFIENAVKYSTENTNRVGIVSILIKKENEDYYYLEIEDNGVGSTDNKNKTSTGIGLQSNRELIEVLNRNNEKYKISFNLLFKDAPESGVIVQIFIPIHYNYNLEYESINSRRRVPLASHFRKSIERN